MLGDYVSDCPYPQRTMEHVWHLKKHFQTWLIKGNREDYQIMHSKGRSDLNYALRTYAPTICISV